MKDVSVLVDLPVFTRQGTFIGHIKNCILDLEARRIEAFILTRTNPEVVEGGHDVAVPYRWVAEFDRIMVLNYFPGKVTAPAAPAEPEKPEGEVVEVKAA